MKTEAPGCPGYSELDVSPRPCLKNTTTNQGPLFHSLHIPALPHTMSLLYCVSIYAHSLKSQKMHVVPSKPCYSYSQMCFLCVTSLSFCLLVFSVNWCYSMDQECPRGPYADSLNPNFLLCMFGGGVDSLGARPR